MAETRKVITKVAEKIDEDGQLGENYGFLNTFANIVDTETGYTLSEFLDNYLQYMKENNFTIVSAEEPQNSHIKIWIDTSSTNQG